MFGKILNFSKTDKKVSVVLLALQCLYQDQFRCVKFNLLEITTTSNDELFLQETNVSELLENLHAYA